jgi:hypothetical protein
MKKIIVLMIFINAFIFGCKDVFKEDEINLHTINSADELNDLVAGLYHQFVNAYLGTQQMLFGNADDVVLYKSQYEDQYSNEIEYVYSANYVAIACANDLLKKSAGLPKNEQVKNLLGEIYFIRGYCYYILAHCYGQPPLIYDSDISYTVHRPSYAEVYDSIVADLNRAIRFLPSTFDESRIKYETPYRGTAKALLAEAFLDMAGYPAKDASAYNKAWKTAKEVMDSAAYYNYALLPDFVNLWDGKHNFNQEGIFSLYFLVKSHSKDDSANYTKADSLAYSSLFKSVITIGSSDYRGGDVGVKFFNNTPDCYRKRNTYQMRQLKWVDTNVRDSFIYDNGTYYFYKQRLDTVEFTSISKPDEMGMKKYYTSVDSMVIIDENKRIPYTGNVFYLLRYAHVLLTYAEAKARDGQLDASAYEAVNRIRRRAHHVDIYSPSKYDLTEGLSSEAFIDSVVWERAYEFCGEAGNRWFDLLRTEQVGKIYELISVNPLFPLPMNKFHFFDLPDFDKTLNPGLYE